MKSFDLAELPERWVIVPPEQLSDDALDGVLHEYISREGTDYGLREVTFEAQMKQAKRAMFDGECILVFDRQTECCQLLSKVQLKELVAESAREIDE
ncbi:MAG: YheU family protein [Pseudomonadales bacterium]|nr:YheU family protein [Pseudomonadales bacterium]